MPWLQVLEILGGVAMRATAAYQKARALAAKDGVSPADLDDADARFLKVYEDPLAENPAVA